MGMAYLPDHCQRGIKLHALLVGKRRKVREERLLSSFHNVFLYEVPLLHLSL